MTRQIPLWILALLVVPITATADQLVTAFLAGDRAEVMRQGSLDNARGLEPRLVSPDRATSLAAIASAPAARDGWQLLPILGDLAAGPDRPIAAAAAAAAAAIAGNLLPHTVFEVEIPRDALATRLNGWRKLAARRDRWADVRVLALSVCADLRTALGRDPGHPADDLEQFADDPDPEVRRAAFESTRAPLSETERLILGRAATSDDDENAALSAAQALCSGIAFGDSRRLARDALGRHGIARVRTLVADSTLPIQARIDAAHCIADGERQSRAALEHLASDTPARWKARVRVLRTNSGARR